MRFIQRSSFELCPVIDVTAILAGTAGSSTSGTLYDLTTNTTAITSTFNNWVFSILETLENPYEVENLTPSICSIESWPLVTRVSSGLGRVKVSFRGISATRSLAMHTLSGGGSTYSVTGFQSDTLGAYTWAIIEPMLLAGGELELFDGTPSTAGYNASCWGADFDFSGVSCQHNATRITERHVLMVSHYLPPVGSTLIFTESDGTKHSRTILAYNSGNTFNGKINVNPVVRDIAVAVLSSAIPSETVAVYPVVGTWVFTDQTVTTTNDSKVSAWVGVKLDQNRKVQICGATDTYPTIKFPVTADYEGVSITKPIFSIGTDWGPATSLPAFLTTHAAFYGQSVGGDSGTPRFVPTASGLILAGCVTDGAGGAMFPDETVVNACIVSADSNAGISTGLTVTVAPDPTL